MSSFRYTSLLPDLAVIDISGPDAISFLHGQLTHDIAGLAPGRAHLAGYCTAKGRLLGTMVIWQARGTDTPTLRALIKADVAQAVAKRLSMFVLRAKVALAVNKPLILGVTDASSQGQATPYTATSADPQDLAACAADLPPNPAPWTVVHTGIGDWVAAPRASAAPARWWLIADGRSVDNQTPADMDQAAWQADDIAAGLPWVQSATQDVFIPQTLNLDLIDGVSFTKGCYPGQEVVARSHYRGTVKRRMAYGVIQDAGGLDAATLAGTDTFDALKPDNPCGRIVNAAKVADAGNGTKAETMHLLMEIQLADLDSADFRLHAPDGPAISLRPLPYDIVSA